MAVLNDFMVQGAICSFAHVQGIPRQNWTDTCTRTPLSTSAIKTAMAEEQLVDKELTGPVGDAIFLDFQRFTVRCAED